MTDQKYSQKTLNLKRNLSNQMWRLNNLYKIRTKDDLNPDGAGTIVDFVMNDAQEQLYDEQWYRNLILKARQLGFTTFIDLLILDTCLYNSNHKAGIIAHHRDDADAIFKEKVKFPFDSMDKLYIPHITATTDRAGEIVFSNGSSIRVSTSFRSGTLQDLHVSELGKIAAKYPEKAKEIRTGAYEAVGLNGRIFIESTAEGREGEFHDQAMTAKKLKDAGTPLTNLDFKFHFFPWHENPEYRLDPRSVLFSSEDIKYFRDLTQRGIVVDEWQQAWWIKKHETLKEEMYREHPSYPEEAFKASVEGAYYGLTITNLRRMGRITRVPWEKGFPVHTSWDLGMDDSTTIWCFQQIGREIRLINYFEDQDMGFEHYVKWLNSTGYSFGNHYLPHDVAVKELGTGKKRIDVLRDLGVRPIIKVPRPKNNDQLNDQINQTRSFLAKCWIDEEHCGGQGLKGLENYRRAWDDKLGAFKRIPLHSAASHSADGLRTGAVGFTTVSTVKSDSLLPPETADY